MRLSDLRWVGAQQTRRDAETARRKIGSGMPEGLGAERPCCGAVAGKSTHAPMT